MNMDIPSRIFQTWKSKNDIPDRMEQWSQSFRRHNPHYAYELWDDFDNREFISREFPWFLNLYDGYPAEIYRADAVRYFYLYTYGGIYADMDTECLRPLDELLKRADVILGEMGTNRESDHSIPNAIMASRPKQDFWLIVIGLLMERAAHNGSPEEVTGPVVLKAAFKLYSDRDCDRASSLRGKVKQALRADQTPDANPAKITLLANNLWYGLDWSNPIHQSLRREVLRGNLLGNDAKAMLFPNAWMVTYWEHSWGSEPS
jgi:inositol phosphorylceramide mannosyltransferase catalytic subunit